MTIRTITAATAALGAAIFALPAHAQSDTYRVNANAANTIKLSICNPQVRLAVRGDGDTDLDFSVTNSSGSVVHSDYDSTDITFATLNRRSGQTCEDFNLRVNNLGSVYNMFTVSLTNVGASSANAKSGAGSGSNDGRNRAVSISNDTGETIMYLYWSNSGATSWGDDRLGSGILSAGQDWNITIDDGSGACRYDIKAQTASGRDILRSGVDVCSSYTIAFN